MQVTHVIGETERVSGSLASRITHPPKLTTFIQLHCSLSLESEIFKNMVLDLSQSQIRDP